MRSKRNLVMALAIAGFAFASCATAADETKTATTVDTEQAKTEIQAMEDAYAAAEKAKDAAGVAAYYSDDAISYMRNEAPVSGKAAITQRIADRMAKDTSNRTSVYKVVDIFAEGDLLTEIGSWTEVDSSGAEGDKGHYMSLFRKKDGKYQCIRDMSVTSSPVKPAM